MGHILLLSFRCNQRSCLVKLATPEFIDLHLAWLFKSELHSVIIINTVWQGMEGAVLGIWCAHGEGRAVFPDPAIHDAVLERQLAPIKYALWAHHRGVLTLALRRPDAPSCGALQ